MQQELNGILPGDTAQMYEELVEALKRKKKQVFGRDIFSNENLSFEPNVNMALPKNYRLGPMTTSSSTSMAPHRSPSRPPWLRTVSSPSRASAPFR